MCCRSRCWCIHRLNICSVVPVVTHFLITTGFTSTPFSFAGPILGVIITTPCHICRALCQPVALLLALVTSHHAIGRVVFAPPLRYVLHHPFTILLTNIHSIPLVKVYSSAWCSAI